MIEFNKKPPLWENEGVEPTPEEITEGYDVGDKVPAPYLNFHLHQTGECIEELQTKLSNENTERKTAEENMRKEISDADSAVSADLTEHTNNKENPHGVTAAQVGLDKVNNTPDSEKAVAFASEAGVGRKVPYNLTVRFNGGSTESTDLFTFNGSTSKSINITPDKIKAAKQDLSNVDDETFKEKAESVGVVGVPIVNGISTDGVAYAATVDGFDIAVGRVISFIPNMTSTSTATTLNVNGTGSIRIYQSLSSITSPMVSPQAENWLSENRPILLMYHETINSVGTVTKCWKTVATRTTNEDIYGTVEVEDGGTGATTAEKARENLGLPALFDEKIDKTAGMGLAGFGSTSDSEKTWETVITIDSATGTPTIKKIPTYLSDLENDSGYARIETGTYVGTGTNGSTNKNTITIKPTTQVVIIKAMTATYCSNMVAVRGCTVATDGDYPPMCTWTETQLSWYQSKSAAGQLNAEGQTYKYVLIG